MNFTWAALASAQAGPRRLWQRVAELPAPGSEPLRPALDAFEAAIGGDCNTTRALAALGDVVRADAPPGQVAATLRHMDRVFGLDLDQAAERLRELDALRADIRALGFLVEDTPEGSQVRSPPAAPSASPPPDRG
jgi:cysteinyl-tRNA synthetase